MRCFKNKKIKIMKLTILFIKGLNTIIELLYSKNENVDFFFLDNKINHELILCAE